MNARELQAQEHPRLERSTMPLSWVASLVAILIGAAVAVAGELIRIDDRMTRVEVTLTGTQRDLGRLEAALSRLPPSCLQSLPSASSDSRGTP